MARSATGPASNETFGELLKRLRSTAGPPNPATGKPTPLSLREVSARTGYVGRGSPPSSVSYGKLGGMELGKSPPPRNPEKLLSLARALGNISYEDLLVAAGYGRKGARSSADELSMVLSRGGLTEDGITEVLEFVQWVKRRQRKAASE